MLNAKNIFDATLDRCGALLSLGSAKDEFAVRCNDDLLRAAVILSVAALDKYCKDRFLEFFEQYFEQMDHGAKLSDECEAYIKKAGVKERYLLKLYQKRESNASLSPSHEISKKLQAYLYKSTFQNDEAIRTLFQCYGLNDIINNAVGKAKNDNVWPAVSHLISRRHQIAHTADYGRDTELKKIKKSQVMKWLEALEELVECIDAILNNRFKKADDGFKNAIKPVSLMGRVEEEFFADFHKSKGYLDAKEFPCLRRIVDIEKLFGVKAKRKGFQYAGTASYPATRNSEIWWPKIAKEPNCAGWRNKPLYDGNSNEIVGIIESNEKSQDLNNKTVRDACERNLLRVVFAVVEGDSSVVGYCYRFLGTFMLDVAASRKKNACVWMRKDSRLSIGYK